jgi:hypothetical protein
MRAVLEQGLKETSILNPSDFVLIPLDITGLLGPMLVSIYHHPAWRYFKTRTSYFIF